MVGVWYAEGGRMIMGVVVEGQSIEGGRRDDNLNTHKI